MFIFSYGLIQPDKYKALKKGEVSAIKPSIFQNDSDSEPEVSKPTGIKKSVKKQEKINYDKALEEDPTVYQYDEIYDEMDQKRKETKLAKKDVDRKPKYINRLLVAAERRKRENERRIERQVQKERELEGEEFKDKESFVTSAYKKKLEEMKELEEQERREEYLESIGDVRKQGNLDGFYRHLYDQKLNYEEKTGAEETEKTEVDNKRKSSESDQEERVPKKAKTRKYRSRKRSNSDEEPDKEPEVENEIKKEHIQSNLDADSDFSIDSSDSEDETGPKEVKSEPVTSEGEKEAKESAEFKVPEIKTEPEDKDEIKPEIKEEVKEKPKKPKVDIWKKRTVGAVFDEALKRYFERKSLRESGL